MADKTKAELQQELEQAQARIAELEQAGGGTPVVAGSDTLVDAIVQAARDLVVKREVAVTATRQHDMGPGGVSEAMKAVGQADRALTEAVLALDQYLAEAQ